MLQHVEARLKTIRAKIIKSELMGVDIELAKIRAQLEQYRQELESLKSCTYWNTGES
jgi:hypothetical protein